MALKMEKEKLEEQMEILSQNLSDAKLELSASGVCSCIVSDNKRMFPASFLPHLCAEHCL